MKKSILFLSLILSANVMAYSITDSTVLTSASPLISSALTSGAGPQKVQAALVINDAQEYMQSGKISAFLGQKIAEAQAINEGVSESEALEMLMNEAESILK